MPTVFIRGMLFFCSYFPLTLIVCILLWSKWPWWAVVLLFLVVGVGSLLMTWIYFSLMLRKGYVHQEIVISFTSRDSEVIGYIASYLIPLVTFPLDNVQQAAILLIFLVVLLILYVNSNMIYINPMLNIVGYHLYEVEIEHSKRPHYYIARKSLERDHEIRFVQLSNDIYLER